jgi:phosphinothricin acetyltransferase
MSNNNNSDNNILNKIKFKIANVSNAEEILSIYSYYVLNTAISFEIETPTIEEFKSRIEKTLKKYPYIIVVKDNEIIGYSYVGPFVGRAAYNWSLETTIYIKKDYIKMGIGKKLYLILENIAKAQGYLDLNACIGYPVKDEDEYITRNSAQFHEHMGYKWIGEFEKCGYKFNRWYNMIWMSKNIGEHTEKPPEIIPFPELNKEILKNIGIDFN